MTRSYSASDAPSAARAVLAEAIDYAGLFPPASLSMATAVSNYATYRNGADAWALGRFVVPLDRMTEFEGEAAAVTVGSAPWRLSGISAGDVVEEGSRVRAFNRTHEGRLTIDSVEGRASTPAAVAALAGAFAGLAVFAELKVDDALPRLLESLREHGVAAKLRTGGVVPEAFPSSRDVARFIVGCVAAEVPFKVTAGLHHAVRGEYSLTYASGSPRGEMFGYLNVFAATAVAVDGGGEEAVASVLERGGASLHFDADALRWGDLQLPERSLARARRDAIRSFGSCSFLEPIEELASLTGAR